mmetsp:Transcript_53660/g.120175  ORF Transcript_53660/g.120175 Transcript_53660/m.120175 type:complete len:409 (-) Transcript_53660:71-1297(-)
MAKNVDRAHRQFLKEKLAGFDLLKELPAPSKEELVTVVEQVHFAKDSVLFNEGDASQDLFLILNGEVKVYKKQPDQGEEDQEDAQRARRPSILARRPSLLGRQSSVGDEVAAQYGTCVGTISSGRAVGVVELMQSEPRSATAVCTENCEMIVVRKPDFTRLIKEQMSRDWVEKDRFLQDHLVGIREHARTFVPITGKSHATHMFVKKKYASGHVFLHEGQISDGALYVVFSGSVEFYRAAGAARAREAWRNPVMEQRKPLGLLQPTSTGILAREYRLCAMLSGGLFGSASVLGEKGVEEFTVVAGPKGCEVFESAGENFQKLPLKVAAAAKEVLAKVLQLHQDRCGVLLATIQDAGGEENPAKLWRRLTAWQGNTPRHCSQTSPLIASSKLQVGLTHTREPLSARNPR